MDTDLLKTFMEVSRTRHFGQAAENLFVTQSAVSARIRTLEDMVAVPLFTRTRNNVQLTAAGQRLIRYAESILLTWNRARQEIAQGEDGQVPLVVGGPASLWDTILGGWLVWMPDAIPDAGLQLEVHNSDVLLRRLDDGTMDLAFVFDAPPNPDYNVLQVTSVPLIMVSSIPGLDANEAVRRNYILVDWGTSFAISHARRFPDLRPPRLRMALGRMALDYLHRSAGTAYLPEPMAAADIEGGHLHRVPDAPVIERNAYAVFPMRDEKDALIRRALEYFE
jgi:DNA-binding transcriptional LysR family regulator